MMSHMIFVILPFKHNKRFWQGNSVISALPTHDFCEYRQCLVFFWQDDSYWWAFVPESSLSTSAGSLASGQSHRLTSHSSIVRQHSQVIRCSFSHPFLSVYLLLQLCSLSILLYVSSWLSLIFFLSHSYSFYVSSWQSFQVIVSLFFHSPPFPVYYNVLFISILFYR